MQRSEVWGVDQATDSQSPSQMERGASPHQHDDESEEPHARFLHEKENSSIENDGGSFPWKMMIVSKSERRLDFPCTCQEHNIFKPPTSTKARVFWLLSFPPMLLFFFTVPDCRKQRFKVFHLNDGFCFQNDGFCIQNAWLLYSKWWMLDWKWWIFASRAGISARSVCPSFGWEFSLRSWWTTPWRCEIPWFLVREPSFWVYLGWIWCLFLTPWRHSTGSSLWARWDWHSSVRALRNDDFWFEKWWSPAAKWWFPFEKCWFSFEIQPPARASLTFSPRSSWVTFKSAFIWYQIMIKWWSNDDHLMIIWCLDMIYGDPSMPIDLSMIMTSMNEW